MNNRLLMKTDINVCILSLFQFDINIKNENFPIFSAMESMRLVPFEFELADILEETRRY